MVGGRGGRERPCCRVSSLVKLGSIGVWMGTGVMQQGNDEGQDRRGREAEKLEKGPVGPARSRGSRE